MMPVRERKDTKKILCNTAISSAMQSAYCIFKILSPFDRTIGYNVEENDVLA